MHIIGNMFNIKDSIFISNKARNGGGIYFDCTFDNPCNISIDNVEFINNSASESGGGVYYNLNRPTLNNLMFTNNSADYGPDIASYAVKVSLI